MRKISLLCLVSLLAASCAQVLTPDGGAKDLTPPVVMDYTPDSAQTNFTGNKITLRFDEFVQLKDLNNQLIVSPPLNQEPDVVIRKRDIVITLKDTLLPNTTYTISFGNAIRDITEGNILDNFRYVFSTGPVIDSLKFSGKVLNAANLNPEKGIYVMLYAATGDSVPLKQRPYYFTKTKEDGSFQMTNLKAGKYKLFALDDKNANYLFDNSEERIAFSDELIDLSQNTEGISLKIFKEIPTKQIRIKAQQSAKGKFFLSYALPLKDPQVTFHPALPAAMEMHKELSVTGDTLDFWFSSVPVDSIQFIIYDAATQFRDSVTLMIDKSAGKNKGGRGGDLQPKELMITANAISGQKFDLGKNLMIVSNNPLKSFTPKDFILTKGKDTLKTDLVLSENKRLLTFNYIFLEDSSYSLFVKPGAITDWFAQKNDTIKVNFKVQESRHYGTLNVKLTNLPAGNYVLQLTNDKNMVLRELKISDTPSVKFDLLPPGNYRLKVIADENKNGKWDTGNYLQHRQPENIIYYDQGLKMRSGWDMDIEWIFK